MLVTREFKFDAAHYLEGYKGDCANLHGHTWRFAVKVAGEINDIGMVIDFKKLKQVVNDTTVRLLDHKCLNHVLPFNPTAENLAVFIFNNIKEGLIACGETDAILISIKLWENYPECYVEYYGGIDVV